MTHRLTPENLTKKTAAFDPEKMTLTFYDPDTFARLVAYLESIERDLDLFIIQH